MWPFTPMGGFARRLPLAIRLRKVGDGSMSRVLLQSLSGRVHFATKLDCGTADLEWNHPLLASE